MSFLLHDPGLALWAQWPLWAASWLTAALWASPASRRPAGPAERRAQALIVLGFALLFCEPLGLAPFGRLWWPGFELAWAMVGVTAAGFALCWWARLHLGALWSFQTMAKADHRVVDTGPYGLVRHPIYSGLLLAAVARAIQGGTPAAVAGLGVLTAAFLLKARVEERFLAEALGMEHYAAYRRRVKALVPFLL